MRKGYSLLLLLICFLGTFAQNWAPINTTDKYNYKLDTASAISHTLWVDSVQVVGGDTVYYMNRIVKAISDSIALKNQPQFLQKQVVVKSSGGYTFSLPNNIGYSNSLALGDSVLYDSTNNISAKVIAADTATVLSNPDSIKILLLSSGDTIIVSKNYGLVQYPYAYGSHKYYWLAGIEGGRNLGEHVAKFHDFFDFHVWDEFEYYTHAYDGDGNCWIDSSVVKLLSRNTNNSTRVDLFDRLSAFFPYCFNGLPLIRSVSHFTSSYLLPDTNNLDINIWPNTIIQVQLLNITEYYDSLFRPFFYNYYRFVGGSAFQFGNAIGCENSSQSSQVYFKGARSFKENNHIVKVFDIFFQQGNLMSDTLHVRYDSSGIFNNYRVFKTGLGLTDYQSSNCFEWGSEGHLISYRTSIDSMGVIDTFITAINEVLAKQLDFKIINNPFSTQLSIKLPEATNASTRLLDLNGSEVLVQQSNDSHIAINTSSLTAGLYIVEVHTKDGVGRKKVIKL